MPAVHRILMLIVPFLVLSVPASAQDERTVDIPTRPGHSVRALLIVPAEPIGSVILLAGGHGNLALTPDGRLGWGAGNQLVRTRNLYARAKYATLVPDIAADHKTADGAVSDYRWSHEHAADIGALVGYMRTLAEPVHLIGTSRAALSVFNTAACTKGRERPDSLVITSGMLIHDYSHIPSAARTVPGLGRITQPTLLIAHANDECFVTAPSSPARFKPLLTAAERVDIKMLSGGKTGGDPCGARSHHGFLGIDSEVVQTIVDWLASLRPG